MNIRMLKAEGIIVLISRNEDGSEVDSREFVDQLREYLDKLDEVINDRKKVRRRKVKDGSDTSGGVGGAR